MVTTTLLEVFILIMIYQILRQNYHIQTRCIGLKKVHALSFLQFSQWPGIITTSVYSGPSILRPPIHPKRYGLKLKVVL